MRTAVVILNWNTREYLLKWLPGLIASCEGRDAEVIVADSGSTDGSLEMLALEFPGIRTVPLGENFGFTGGYNRAVSRILSPGWGQGGTPEFIVLINSDIEVQPDWLDPLVSWMDSHPKCGICGPKILSLNDRDSFEYAGAAGGFLDRFGFPYCRGRVMGHIEKDHGQYDTPAAVTWVSGACLMVRSSLWQLLGGLDDRFFAHMEEIDLCWRAAREGQEVWVVPDSAVYHLGGGTLPQKSPFKLFLNYRNNLLLLDGNLPGKKRWKVLARMIIDFFAAFAYFCKADLKSVKAVYRAHKEFRKLRTRDTRKDNVDKLDGSLLVCQYLKRK